MLLSSIEFAQKLKVSESLLRQSRSSGLLFGVPSPKYLKLGRSIRYRPEEVESWLAQFEAEAEGM